MSEISKVFTFQNTSREVRGQVPFNPDLIRQTLRHLEEELRETNQAWTKIHTETAKTIKLKDAPDIAEVADGFIDLIYVAAQGLWALGLAREGPRMFSAVHRANMEKLNRCPVCHGKYLFCAGCESSGRWGATKSPEGKIMKPAEWRAPDLTPFVQRELFND